MMEQPEIDTTLIDMEPRTKFIWQQTWNQDKYYQSLGRQRDPFVFVKPSYRE